MKRLFLILIVYITAANGYYDFSNAADNINKNIQRNVLGNTYTVHDYGNRVYVNGPDGYFGCGQSNNNSFYYTSYDNNSYNNTSIFGSSYNYGNSFSWF